MSEKTPNGYQRWASLLLRPRCVGLLAACCLILATAIWVRLDIDPPSAIAIRNNARIAYLFTIRNTSGTPVSGATLLVHAPAALTAGQQCTRLQASCESSTHTDAIGNQWAALQLPTVPPYGRLTVRLDADLQFPGSVSGRASDEIHHYLTSSPHMPSDADAILTLAASLTGASHPETARRIFDWVAANLIKGPYAKRSRGALFALTEGTGDCTEHAQLLIALCRAAGIPARGVSGYPVTGNAVLDPTAYHDWAEVWIGNQWQTLDPFDRKWAPPAGERVATRIQDYHIQPVRPDFHRFRVDDHRLVVRQVRS